MIYVDHLLPLERGTMECMFICKSYLEKGYYFRKTIFYKRFPPVMRNIKPTKTPFPRTLNTKDSLVR